MRLTKQSPLAAVYRGNQVACREHAGWLIAEHFGQPELDSQCLETGSLLVDWSHIGKISLRGLGATQNAGKVLEASLGLKPLQGCSRPEHAVLKLTDDEYMVLCHPEKTEYWIAQFDPEACAVIDASGGMGCLVLAGTNRDAVLERSTAMDLRRDRVPPGSVVQTTVHMMRCTIFRTSQLDILLLNRDFTESLFDALMDVGKGVGMLPSGLRLVPVSFSI